MKQRAAIVGVGATPLSRDAGVSCQELACAAINAALQDAGVTREQLDGLLAYSLGDSVPVTTVARALGLPRLRWHNDIHGGGSQSDDAGAPCQPCLRKGCFAVSGGA